MALLPTPKLPYLERWKHGVLENFQRPIGDIDPHAFGPQPQNEVNEHTLFTCGTANTEYEQNCDPSLITKGPFLRVVRGIGTSIPHLFYAAAECSTLPDEREVSPSNFARDILLTGLELRIEDRIQNDYLLPVQIPFPAQPTALCAAGAAAQVLSSSFSLTNGVGYLFVDPLIAAQLYDGHYLREVNGRLEDPFGNIIVVTRSRPETEHKIYALLGSFDIYVTEPRKLPVFERDVIVNNTRRSIWEQEWLIVPNVCAVTSIPVEGPCN